VHSAAVKRRADVEGYVPSGAAQYDTWWERLGHWFLDPTLDRGAPVEGRLNIPVWRQRLRDAAGAKKPGESMDMLWQVEMPSRFLGTETHDFVVNYQKLPDGTWRAGPAPAGMPVAPPDLNRIMDPSVSDGAVESMITYDPRITA
jgi:hypothetical protein